MMSSQIETFKRGHIFSKSSYPWQNPIHGSLL